MNTWGQMGRENKSDKNGDLISKPLKAGYHEDKAMAEKASDSQFKRIDCAI